jgi:hypothetical protein
MIHKWSGITAPEACTPPAGQQWVIIRVAAGVQKGCSARSDAHFFLKRLFPGGPSLKSECVRQIAFRATPILIDEDPKREVREIIAPPHYIQPCSTRRHKFCYSLSWLQSEKKCISGSNHFQGFGNCPKSCTFSRGIISAMRAAHSMQLLEKK